MNLARHASVLWRFRRVTAAGVLLGIALAVFAGYHVSSSGLTPRGTESWSAVSSILVTQAGFPEGRVTLPQKQIGAVPTEETEGTKPSDEVEFADPARLSGLGDLYSKFLTSDVVLSRVPGHPSPASVQASPFASSQGGLLLPVIQLTTMGPTAQAAHKTNVAVHKALLDYMDEQADANEIAKSRRIELKILVAPEVMLLAKPKPTASILVFLLVMLGTVAATHLLEALRNRKQSEVLSTIVDWDAPSTVLDDSEEPVVHASNGDAEHRRLHR